LLQLFFGLALATGRKGGMATDGLWDCLTKEEVVGLVGECLETRGEGSKDWEKRRHWRRKDGDATRQGPSGEDPKKGFGKGRSNGWPGEGSNGGSDQGRREYHMG